MANKKIYIVKGQTGLYDDSYEWYVAAYFKKNMALAHAKKATEDGERFYEVCTTRGDYSMFDKNFSCWDKNMQCSGCRPIYNVEVVELYDFKNEIEFLSHYFVEFI